MDSLFQLLKSERRSAAKEISDAVEHCRDYSYHLGYLRGLDVAIDYIIAYKIWFGHEKEN